MWEIIGALASVGSLLWSIVSDNRAAAERRAAEIAAAEAAMWRSVFWIAVIVIAVIAFLIWKKYSSNTQAIEKPEER